MYQCSKSHSFGLLQVIRDFFGYIEVASIRRSEFLGCPNQKSFIVYPQICWYLAAVVQVQVCKHFIEIGDEAREDQVWGEINVLRYAL